MGRPAIHPLRIQRSAEKVHIQLHRVERCNALGMWLLQELAEVLHEGDARARPLLLDGDGGIFSALFQKFLQFG